jgi:hypothetical protein
MKGQRALPILLAAVMAAAAVLGYRRYQSQSTTVTPGIGPGSADFEPAGASGTDVDQSSREGAGREPAGGAIDSARGDVGGAYGVVRVGASTDSLEVFQGEGRIYGAYVTTAPSGTPVVSDATPLSAAGSSGMRAVTIPVEAGRWNLDRMDALRRFVPHHLWLGGRSATPVTASIRTVSHGLALDAVWSPTIELAVAGPDGASVRGITVFAVHGEAPRSTSSPTSEPGNGAVPIPCESESPVTIPLAASTVGYRVSAPGYCWQEWRPDANAIEKRHASLELRPESRILVNIVGASPIAGACLRLYRDDGGARDVHVVERAIDGSRSVELEKIDPGDYWVSLEIRRSQVRPIVVDEQLVTCISGRTSEVHVRMTQGELALDRFEIAGVLVAPDESTLADVSALEWSANSPGARLALWRTGAVRARLGPLRSGSNAEPLREWGPMTLPTGEYTVRAVGAPFADVVIVDRSASFVTLVIPALRSVAINVVDGDSGEPIDAEAAYVSVGGLRRGDARPRKCSMHVPLTGGAGVVRLPAGPASAYVSVDGYGRASKDFDVGAEGGRVELRMARQATVRLRVEHAGEAVAFDEHWLKRVVFAREGGQVPFSVLGMSYSLGESPTVTGRISVDAEGSVEIRGSRLPCGFDVAETVALLRRGASTDVVLEAH